MTGYFQSPASAPWLPVHIASGSVGTGDELLFPSGRKCRVKGIQSLFLNVNEAGAGKGRRQYPNIGTESIKRGDMLVSPALKGFIDESVKANILRGLLV